MRVVNRNHVTFLFFGFDIKIMFLRIIVYSSLLLLPVQCIKVDKCVTGYMTDVQSWVDEKGVLTNKAQFQTSLDLSANLDPVSTLQRELSTMRSSNEVKYLSLARCRLTRVPNIFQFDDPSGRNLAETVEYVTFFGNIFQDVTSPDGLYDASLNTSNALEQFGDMVYQTHIKSIWSIGIKEIKFARIKELDLRACSIQNLDGHIFEGMPTLEALYIGENEVINIDAQVFSGLNSLIHLDFSRNEAYDDMGNRRVLESLFTLEHLKKLASLDFSYTKMSNQLQAIFKELGPNLTRLSICQTGLRTLSDDIFNRTSLRILDVSGNSNMLSNRNVLRGIENTLEVLYAKDNALKKVDVFKGFHKLQILILQMNEITSFDTTVAKTLRNLQILDLDMNRLSSWFEDIFSLMPNLQFLSIKHNNINVISKEMTEDFANIDYLSLSENFIVCNCHARDFMDVALRNEQKENLKPLKENNKRLGRLHFHKAYIEYNDYVKFRVKVTENCTAEDVYRESCYGEFNEDIKGKYLLVDFHPNSYTCLRMPESDAVTFFDIMGCDMVPRTDYHKGITKSNNVFFVLLVLPVFMVLFGVTFWFRRNIRYFYITMRNSALLSVINKDNVLNENAIFYYDVFVSYCNEDRGWVLDHLLPHLEMQCNFSACLHERDFRVGHSILENIVSCMDRSRSIMLIISRKFLLSQWCQFEMHLAQHRLLETRREDLTLVLLEEIPRRYRPNTLHYLMLTKTYIVWPKDERERGIFWKRLEKTLLMIKMKHVANEVSLS